MYLKYLKYKNKYLELKNQIGGKPKQIEQAFTNLKNFFTEGKDVQPMIDHMNTDEELRRLVLGEASAAAAAVPVLHNFTSANTKDDTILKKIFCAILSKIEQLYNEEKQYDEKCYDNINIKSEIKHYIIWIINSYIRITIPNITTLTDVMKDIINYNRHRHAGQPEIKDLYGYQPSSSNHDPATFLKPLVSMFEMPSKQKTKEEKYLDLLKETCILDTTKLSIHIPRTKEESIKLGRDTRWCTAAHSKENMFEKYNIKGPLYIIIPKYPAIPNEKYQLLACDDEIDDKQEHDELKNKDNEDITPHDLLERFDDKDFKKWFYDKFYVNIEIIKEEEYNLIKKLHLAYLDKVEHFPKLTSLTHLRFDGLFGDDYNEPIGVGVLPQSLTHLTFGDEYNKLINVDVLPQSLTHLTFGYEYNETIGVNVLPQSLTHLIFGFEYNKSIGKDVLPQSLTHLTFGPDYNELINEDVLPQSLTHLTFGYDYNKLINVNVLPQSLTHLTFGHDYNEQINVGVLPESLTHLTFGFLYDKPIGVLPESLIYLKIHKRYKEYKFMKKIETIEYFE